MKASIVLPILLGIAGVAAQNNASTANGCNGGFYPGRDEVIYTVPYTYTQVMSIIGNFSNLTWSGNPDGTVTINGTDNTVGTARFYDIVGAHIVETITTYSKPANGPYEEIHVLGPATIPAANVTIYADYDGTTVTEVCNGAASVFNFTAIYCATNATVGGSVLHGAHLGDAQTVGKFLGGQNFSSCAAISASNSTTTSPTTSSTPAMTTANSATAYMASMSNIILLAGSVVTLLAL